MVQRPISRWVHSGVVVICKSLCVGFFWGGERMEHGRVQICRGKFERRGERDEKMAGPLS